MKIKKKYWFPYFKRLIRRSGHVMKGKNGIANEFQMDFKNVNSNGGNVAKRNSKSMQFFFLKIVKIEPANKVQSFVLE
jgi:hypothetical protein